jgi:hypothetical protein
MFRKLLCVLTLLVAAPSSFAHPMGNFSVNHYSKISLDRDGIKLTYIIDLAEIPTYQELQQGNVTADVADPSVKRFVESRGQEFARGLSLMLDGKRLPLKLLSSQVIFPPGAGGLPTMKMGFVYQAAYRAGERTADPSTTLLRSSGPSTSGRDDDKGESGGHPQNRLVDEKAGPTTGNLQYSDNNYPGHAGWKEIIAVPNAGVNFITTSAPAKDRSASRAREAGGTHSKSSRSRPAHGRAGTGRCCPTFASPGEPASDPAQRIH